MPISTRGLILNYGKDGLVRLNGLAVCCDLARCSALDVDIDGAVSRSGIPVREHQASRFEVSDTGKAGRSGPVCAIGQAIATGHSLDLDGTDWREGDAVTHEHGKRFDPLGLGRMYGWPDGGQCNQRRGHGESSPTEVPDPAVLENSRNLPPAPKGGTRLAATG
jgi:hypothetical protein